MWVITMVVNAYNQEGEYLERVFKEKPSVDRLNELGYNGEHLHSGGGRRIGDDKWYYLVEVNDGEKYVA